MASHSFLLSINAIFVGLWLLGKRRILNQISDEKYGKRQRSVCIGSDNESEPGASGRWHFQEKNPKQREPTNPTQMHSYSWESDRHFQQRDNNRKQSTELWSAHRREQSGYYSGARLVLRFFKLLHLSISFINFQITFFNWCKRWNRWQN